MVATSEIIDLAQRGLYQSEIARRLGVSRQRIHQVVRASKLSVPRQIFAPKLKKLRPGPRCRTVEDLFSKTVPLGDCLVWTGSRTPQGYGKVRSGGRQVYTHRAIVAALFGPIPNG